MVSERTAAYMNYTNDVNSFLSPLYATKRELEIRCTISLWMLS
jgi:hypothetical protein